MNLEDVALQAERLTGFQLERSRLALCPSDRFQAIKQSLKTEDIDGFYSPSKALAVVDKESRYLLPTVFHELFGHGLFCEHSGIGKEILRLDSQKLQSPVDQYLPTYEGFAVWLESKLSEDNGCGPLFDRKLQEINPSYQEWFGDCLTIEGQFGTFGVIAAANFPKKDIRAHIPSCIQALYGNIMDQILLVLWYGSRQPLSDIDLLVISTDRTEHFCNGWLDIYMYSMDDVARMAALFDPAMTDPLSTGEPVLGDGLLHENLKGLLGTLPITYQAIEYNLHTADQLKEMANSEKDRLVADKIIRYSNSCQWMSRSLANGEKILTLRGLQEKYGQNNNSLTQIGIC